MRGGDWLQMTWEMVGVSSGDGLSEEQLRKLPELPMHLGSCTMTDVVTRLPPVFESFEFDEVEVIVNSKRIKVYGLDGYIEFVTTEGAPFNYPSDPFYEKVQQTGSYNRAAPESFSSCTTTPFTQPSASNYLLHNIANPQETLFTCPTWLSGGKPKVSGCGLRCTLKPAQDLQLSRSSYGNKPNPANDFTSIKMMVVPSAGRTIARPMTRLNNSGDYEWHVDVSRAPDGSGLQRWSENFTPHIQVKRVAFFYLDEQGQPQMITQLAGNRLSVDLGDAAPLSCVDDGNGHFEVGSHATESHPCGDFRAVTPTYDIEQLSEVAGRVLDFPAHWLINLPELAAPHFADTPVYIEFELDVAMSPAALMIEEDHGKFSDVPTGGKVQLRRRLLNVGSQPIRVERIHVADNLESRDYLSEPAAFQVRVPYDAQMLPLRIGWEEGGVKPDETLSVLKMQGEKQTPDLSAAFAPLMSVSENVSGSMVVRPGKLDGETHKFYGEPVTFDGSYGFYENPNADFAALANERLVNPQARFALASTVFRDRITPFVLAPGESQEILLDFSPTSYGKKTARLKVEGSAIGTGGQLSASIPLYGSALTPPLAEALPTAVHLPRRLSASGSAMLTSNFLLINNGQTDLVRNSFAVKGTHAHLFDVRHSTGANSRIGPGQSETFQIDFMPPSCHAPRLTGAQNTALELDTNVGTIRVRLTADLDFCTN
jgi:hypothetical protein